MDLNLNLQHGVCSLRKIQPLANNAGRRVTRCAQRVMLGDKQYAASRRFWNSLLSRFQLSDNVFQYFPPDEVFRRIAKVKGNDDLAYTVDPAPVRTTTKDGMGGVDKDCAGTLLAITAKDTQFLDQGELQQLIKDYNGFDAQLHQGQLSVAFHPGGEEREVQIGPDGFREQYRLDVPLDGYGRPNTVLELLRLVCTNGAVARSAAYRADVNLGKKDPMHTLDRVLTTFDAPEQFQHFRERLVRAQCSMLSVREAEWLRQLLLKHPAGNALVMSRRFDKVVGDFTAMYGLTNTQLLSVKRQALLSSKASVYDVVNLVTELTSHYSTGAETIAYQGFLGSLLTSDLDLEGTIEKPAKTYAKFIIPERDEFDAAIVKAKVRLNKTADLMAA